MNTSSNSQLSVAEVGSHYWMLLLYMRVHGVARGCLCMTSHDTVATSVQAGLVSRLSDWFAQSSCRRCFRMTAERFKISGRMPGECRGRRGSRCRSQIWSWRATRTWPSSRWACRRRSPSSPAAGATRTCASEVAAVARVDCHALDLRGHALTERLRSVCEGCHSLESMGCYWCR